MKVRVCIIYRIDVVARVDRRVDSSTILRLSSSLTLTGRDGCIESNSKSLYRAREVNIRAGLESRKRINCFRRSNKNIIESLGLNEQAQNFRLR